MNMLERKLKSSHGLFLRRMEEIKGVVHGPSELIMLIVAKKFEESHLI